MAKETKPDSDSRFLTLADRPYQCEYLNRGEKRQAALKPVGLVKKEYWSAFHDYDNVEVDAKFNGFRTDDRQKRGAPHSHGLEIERDLGYIRITEEKPIVAVAGLGSGCLMPAYVVCEYPQPGETMKGAYFRGPWGPELIAGTQQNFNMQNLRRQRVDGLMSEHPSGCVRTPSEELIIYEMDYEPRVFECTARFEIEPTTTITIRGGSGTSGHFSFRMIRLYFEA